MSVDIDVVCVTSVSKNCMVKLEKVLFMYTTFMIFLRRVRNMR